LEVDLHIHHYGETEHEFFDKVVLSWKGDVWWIAEVKQDLKYEVLEVGCLGA
jgi:hypothetical protein